MKKILCLVLSLCILTIPFSAFAEDATTDSVEIKKIGDGVVEYTLQTGIITTADMYSDGVGVEVGDQFLVDIVTSVPEFLTAGIYGSFDNSIAKIVAPVYSNEYFGVITNKFSNEDGTFTIEGYDTTVSGIEDTVVCSILFEAIAPGEFVIDLSDECLLGKVGENAFYELSVLDNKLVISENTDDNNKMIIEEPAPITPFDDMLGYDWAEREVGVMYKLGVLEDIANESYYPGENITRGDFVTMLMRVCKQKSTKEIEMFADVASDSYQYDCIMIAKALGIAKGDEDGNFRPDEPITRQDICSLVFRTMLKMNKVDPEINPDDYMGSFTDKDSVAEYAKESVAGLIRAKLIIGDDTGLLRPTDNMTRAEAAVLLNRLAEFNILVSRG